MGGVAGLDHCSRVGVGWLVLVNRQVKKERLHGAAHKDFSELGLSPMSSLAASSTISGAGTKGTAQLVHVTYRHMPLSCELNHSAKKTLSAKLRSKNCHCEQLS